MCKQKTVKEKKRIIVNMKTASPLSVFSITAIIVVTIFLCLRYIPGAPWHMKACVYDVKTCKEVYDQGHAEGYNKGYQDGAAGQPPHSEPEPPSNPLLTAIGTSVTTNGTLEFLPGFCLLMHPFQLLFQSNGELVVINNTDVANPVVVSSSGTTGSTAKTAVRGVFSVSLGGKLELLNSAGTPIWIVQPSNPANTIALNPDGRVLLRNTITNKLVWAGHLNSVPVLDI
jgi:hypothetical protein